MCQQRAKRLAIRLRSLLPVGADRIPSFAQTLFVSVAVLRDDRGDPFGMLNGKPEARWRAVIEYVHGKPVETDHLGETPNDLCDVVERVCKTFASRHVRLHKT